jgi:hypothetical protein
MNFTDAVMIAGTRTREDGSLLADARIARTGIQTYTGAEVGKPDMALVRVYRPGSEVFNKDTMASAAHKPVTNDHPAEFVTADNWKEHAVGQTGDEIAGEGIFIRVPLMVSDGATIKLIEDGKRELSAGYTCDLDFSPGKTHTGEAYDAIQRNIRVNHVAIVHRGRAGSQVRIGDAGFWGAAPMSTPADERNPAMSDTLRTVMVDGLSIQTTDQGAQVITKLQTALADSAANVTKLQTDHSTALAAKDAELAKKDAEIDGLKAKVLSDADLDKRVAARADLIGKAKAIVKDIKTDGLTDAAIRKAVVIAKRGEAVKDKPDAYIDAAFDLIVEDGGTTQPDPFKQAMADFKPSLTDAQAAEKARADYINGLGNAWKGEAGKSH